MLSGSQKSPHTFIPIRPVLPPSPPINIPVSPAWNYNIDQLLIEIISKRNTINVETIQKIMRLINNEPEPIVRNNKTVFFKRENEYIFSD